MPPTGSGGRIAMNYSEEQYLELIKGAESINELNLVCELLEEDKNDKSIHILSYITIKANYLVKLTELHTNQAKKNLEPPAS